LILPHVNLDIKYYDLGMEYREKVRRKQEIMSFSPIFFFAQIKRRFALLAYKGNVGDKLHSTRSYPPFACFVFLTPDQGPSDD